MTELLDRLHQQVNEAIDKEEWAKLFKLGQEPDEQTRKELLQNGWAECSLCKGNHHTDLHPGICVTCCEALQRYADDGGPHHD
jgi:hypothetical protein